MEPIPESLKAIIGKPCCKAEVSTSKYLFLDFGNKLFVPSEEGEDFRGEWGLSTWSCTWRIVKDNKILCGGYDSLRESVPYVQQLNEISILDIRKFNDYDIELEFENGFHLQLISETASDRHFYIIGPNDKYYEYSEECKWIEQSSLDSEEFNEQEKLIDRHSKRCYDRWKKKLNNAIDYRKCKNCAYYIESNGSYYFWDIGICSNKKSFYDGRAVGEFATCEHFSDNLK